MSDAAIRFLEWMAGKLLLNSGRLRSHRRGPNDAHEMRHLYAALRAGDSDPCDKGAACHLDRATIHDFEFGEPEGKGG